MARGACRCCFSERLGVDCDSSEAFAKAVPCDSVRCSSLAVDEERAGEFEKPVASQVAD